MRTRGTGAVAVAAALGCAAPAAAQAPRIDGLAAKAVGDQGVVQAEAVVTAGSRGQAEFVVRDAAGTVVARGAESPVRRAGGARLVWRKLTGLAPGAAHTVTLTVRTGTGSAEATAGFTAPAPSCGTACDTRLRVQRIEVTRRAPRLAVTSLHGGVLRVTLRPLGRRGRAVTERWVVPHRRWRVDLPAARPGRYRLTVRGEAGPARTATVRVR
jgi:hypothetical protein